MLLSLSIPRTWNDTQVPLVNAAAGIIVWWFDPEVRPAVSVGGRYWAATPKTDHSALTRSPDGPSTSLRIALNVKPLVVLTRVCAPVETPQLVNPSGPTFRSDNSGT